MVTILEGEGKKELSTWWSDYIDTTTYQTTQTIHKESHFESWSPAVFSSSSLLLSEVSLTTHNTSRFQFNWVAQISDQLGSLCGLSSSGTNAFISIFLAHLLGPSSWLLLFATVAKRPYSSTFTNYNKYSSAGTLIWEEVGRVFVFALGIWLMHLYSSSPIGFWEID